MNCKPLEDQQKGLIQDLFNKLLVYDNEADLFEVSETECILEEDAEVIEEDRFGMEDLEVEPAHQQDLRAEVQDPLEEVELGDEQNKRPTFVSGLLEKETKEEIIKLLEEYQDCFAWDYHEMPGLDRTLVEHRLPIKPEFRPFKQPPRRMTLEVTLKIKEEIERLPKAGFIKPIRYAEWISNIVPVVKKNGKLRVCIDFRNLNLATPKDEYPMPVADLLVDRAAGHKILSFMDGHSGYNQIFISEEDLHKTTFRCPGAIGMYAWVKMPFGLINAGATYQKAMNVIFHDLIGKSIEVYIDDIVVKSKKDLDHLQDLRMAFERMRKYKLKMNPAKCVFGVRAGNFLGFLVHQRGIEVDKNKAKAIREIKPPMNKNELQKFMGQINFLRRFISNLSGKTSIFSPLLKLKACEDFKWEAEHQKAFEQIKEYLTKPPVLIPPVPHKSLRLYLSTAERSLGAMLAQVNEQGHEHAVYYLSKTFTCTEQRYTPMEKACFSLFYTADKLKHYFMSNTVYVISKTDLVKYMLSRPISRSRIGRWAFAISGFAIKYMPRKAIKSQVLADFFGRPSK